MKFTKKNKQGVTYVQAEGRLDSEAAEQLEKEASNWVYPDRSLVLDMKGVDYVGEEGMKNISNLAKMVKAKKGEFALVGVKTEVRRVLSGLGINRLVNVYDNYSAFERDR